MTSLLSGPLCIRSSALPPDQVGVVRQRVLHPPTQQIPSDTSRPMGTRSTVTSSRVTGACTSSSCSSTTVLIRTRPDVTVRLETAALSSIRGMRPSSARRVRLLALVLVLHWLACSRDVEQGANGRSATSFRACWCLDDRSGSEAPELHGKDWGLTILNRRPRGRRLGISCNWWERME